MKVNALTAAAVALAGLAVFQFARTRGGMQPSGPIFGGIVDYHSNATDQVWGMARDQRQASGAALPVNTAYLTDWRAYGATQPDF